jgi:carboxymethylenebutenolidase
MTLAEAQPVDLPTPKGPMLTYVYAPTAPGNYPGILLFSEIFQVTAPIRRTAAFLAGHGFIVAVPEIYHEFPPTGFGSRLRSGRSRPGQRPQNDQRTVQLR